MQKADYSDFYNTVIKPYIEEITADCGLGECKDKGSHCKYRIYKCYQEKRDSVKNKYMQKADDVALDRHKVAACMVYAILKVQPIKVNRFLWNLPEQKLLANEYLAFYVALNIIAMYKRDELREAKMEKEAADYEIIVPKTYHEGEGADFVSNTCRALYYLRLRGLTGFDIFAYATIFFMLEKYTDTITNLKIVKE